MSDLQQRRTALLAYAQSCLAAEDWHGLSDAAMDLLVVDARLEERAGRIEPVRYATADGRPGDVVYQPVDPNGRLGRNWITPRSCLICGEPDGHGNLPCPQLQPT